MMQKITNYCSYEKQPVYRKKHDKVGKRLQVQGANSIIPAIKNDHLLNLSSIYAMNG